MGRCLLCPRTQPAHCVYVCMRVCVYLCVSVLALLKNTTCTSRVCVYVYMYVCLFWLCSKTQLVHACMRVCVYVCVFVLALLKNTTCTCMYVCIYVCTCECMYVYPGCLKHTTCTLFKNARVLAYTYICRQAILRFRTCFSCQKKGRIPEGVPIYIYMYIYVYVCICIHMHEFT